MGRIRLLKPQAPTCQRQKKTEKGEKTRQRGKKYPVKGEEEETTPAKGEGGKP